jgi:putative RecB family exonuclease
MISQADTYALPEYMSPSSLATFDQCPLKFKYYRLDRLEQVPSEPAIIGSFVHEVIEYLYLLPSEDRTLAAARTIARQKWEETWEGEYHTIPNPSPINEFRWKVWWLIENYFAMEDPTSIEPTGIEDEIRGELNGVPMLGLIDRWSMEDHQIVVSDYKTGKKPRPRYEWEKQKQITIYGILLGNELDREVKRAELIYLKPGKFARYNMDPEVVDRVTEEVTDTWTQVQVACKTGKFETRTGPLCNWCDYKAICPEWN